MRLRLLSSPWWIRWLAITCLFAVALAVVPVLAAPALIQALRWPWPLVLLGFTGVALGGLWAFVTEPQHRLYLAALDGLSPADQGRAVRAIRHGEVPDDPAVLGAAVQLSRLSGSQESLVKRQLVISVVAIALWIVLAVVTFAVGDVRQGVFWLLLAAIYGVLILWDRRRRERIRRNVVVLRAAADQIPGGVSAEPSTGEFEASIRRATRIWAVGAVVIIVAAVALTLFLGRTSADCRAGRNLVGYLGEHRDLMDPGLIAPGWPPLADYEAWSGQLRKYADGMSERDVATHADKISELSMQAVAIVREARADAAGLDLKEREAAYLVVANGITNEMWAIVDVCRISVQHGR